MALGRNILALYVLHGANYLLPLLALPYLLRVLGPQSFGLYVFALAVTQFFVLIADFGFNFTATREVAAHRNNPAKLSAVFWTITMSKAALAAGSAAVFAALVFSIPGWRADWPVFMASGLAILGSVALPVWMLQGLERMTALAAVNILSKSLSLVLLFVLVKDPADTWIAVALQTGSIVVAGLITHALLFSTTRLTWVRTTLNDLVSAIRKSKAAFASSFFSGVYTSGNTFLVGLMGGYYAAGQFGAGDRLVRAVHGLMWPLFQATYPRASSYAAESRERVLAFFWWCMRRTIPVTLATSALLFAFAEELIVLLFGNAYPESVVVVRVMACLPFIVGISNMLVFQLIFPLGLDNACSRIIMTAGVLNTCLVVVAYSLFGLVGASLSIVATELFVTIAMIIVLCRAPGARQPLKA